MMMMMMIMMIIMMMMEQAHAVWWERSKYFLPVLSNFQGFFLCKVR